MKIYYFLLLFFFGFTKLKAQEKHFIFIQSDNNQIFNVSVNGKVYSSTASGYVIIPKLLDGEYTLNIAFAQNATLEQTFKCTIDHTDLGYNLKNLGEKGFALFNLQTLNITTAQAAGSDEVSKALAATKKSTEEPIITFDRKPTSDSIATTNSNAVKKDIVTTNADTGSISTGAAIKRGTTDTTPALANVEVDNKSKKKRKKKKDESAAPIAATTSDENGITKVSQTTDGAAVSLSYTDVSGKGTDTIKVEIPSAASSSATTGSSENTTAAESPKIEGGSSVQATTVLAATETVPEGKKSKSKKREKKEELKFLDVDMSGKTMTDSASTTEKKVISKPADLCSSMATDEDYVRLRRKMAMESTDDKMIKQAKLSFKDKCFTTRQVKSLSTLFLSDEGRYRFFSASFSFVSDPEHYSSLESEFIDPSFVKRFRSILE